MTCLELIQTTVLQRSTYQFTHKLHLQYWKLFNEIPQPKDEIVSFVLIASWFLIHSTIFKLQTPEERNKIDQRFLLNSYHVLLYYINGLYVSDEFVQQQVDLYLNSKYLDYRLNSFQKKNLKKQQQLQQTQTNLFPNVPVPELTQVSGGAQFQRELKLRKKQKKQQSEPIFLESQQPLQRMERSERGGRFPNSIKFNLNQLSPSINSLLNYSQKGSPKPKLVTHQIISHNLSKPKVSNTLKSFEEQRSTLTQIKENRDHTKGQRLLDKYRVTQPPLEYFKKHPKVDHLFRDMLEMKLVLQQSHQHIQTSPRLVKEDSTALREKLTQYLEERQLKQSIGLSEEMFQSPIGSNMMITYQHIRTPSDGVRAQESHTAFPQNPISSFAQTNLSPQPKVSGKQYAYEDKRKLYIERFNKATEKQSTEDKISNIQQQVKQSSLQKKL